MPLYAVILARDSGEAARIVLQAKDERDATRRAAGYFRAGWHMIDVKRLDMKRDNERG
jgi:hypothetical protein